MLALSMGFFSHLNAQETALYNAKMQLKADTNIQLTEAIFEDWKKIETTMLFGMTTQFVIPPTYRYNYLAFRGYYVFTTTGNGGFYDVSFKPFRVVRSEQKLIQKEIIPAFEAYLSTYVAENKELLSSLKANTTYYLPYSFKAVKPIEIVDQHGYFVPVVLEIPKK